MFHYYVHLRRRPEESESWVVEIEWPIQIRKGEEIELNVLPKDSYPDWPGFLLPQE